MAYQTKSYRKFVATAATAALVASAVAPAASAASVSQFKDVAAKYQDAVKYLVDNGITEGTSKTTFGTYDSVKRGDAAVWIAKALKLDTSKAPDAGFKDVNSRVAGAVNALYAAKIISGKSATSFAPDATLTRGEMAKIIANAYNLESNKDVPFKDLGPTFGPYIKALYEFGITTGTSETTFGTGNNITRGDFAIFLKRASEVDVNVEPAVVGVSAINAKQVEVKFSQAMDEDTLIGAGNLIKNVTFKETTTASDAVDSTKATGKLSADGKVLTITLDPTETFEGTYAITVSNDAKTKNNESIKDFSDTFSIKDEVAPQIVKVSAKTNTNVATSATITFSEPVSAAVVKINGTVYSPSGMGTTELSFTGLSLDATKTHTIEVLNATDAKNNIKPLQTTTFQVNKDTIAPTVSYQAVGDHKIKLTFNKDMNVGSITPNSVKVVEEDLTSLASPADYTVSQVGNSKKEFIVDVAKALYGSKSERTLTIQVNDTAKDELGNKAVVTTQNVKLTKDTVAPTMSDVSVVTDRQGNAEKLRIKFNEELAGVPADLSKISAKNAVTGVDETVTNLLDATTLTLSSDKKTIEVGILPAALGKKVNLVFSTGFVQDTAQTPNDSQAFSKAVEFKQASSAFKITQVDNVDVSTQNTIIIDFKTEVVGDFGPNAANNPSNYSVAGQPLPADTSITMASTRDEVTIVLPDEFVSKTDPNAVLTVNNIKSLSGNVITPFVGYANVLDNVTPKLEKVVWNTNGTFTLSFSEAITEASSQGTEDGVEIKLNDGAFTLADTDYTFAAGTGADAGKIVVSFETANDPVHGTYIELGGNPAVYDAGTDILVADIVNVSVKILDNNNIKDAAGNDAKKDITVVGKK